MRPTIVKGIAAAAAIALLGGSASAGAPRADRKRAVHASAYVAETQNDDGSFGFGSVGATADGIMSLAALRRGESNIEAAFGFIETQEVTSVGDMAKVVMALVATGRNPHDYMGRDLVQEILDSEQPDGRYGADEFLYAHTLAMLALAAAGADVGTEPTVWLGEAQCRDGGWQFDQPSSEDDDRKCLSKSDPANDFTTSDTNTTALAQMALAVSPGVYPGKNPYRYFSKMRDRSGGGWGYDRAFPLTDANSTALVLQAYAATGKKPPSGAKEGLRRLQYGKCSKHGPAFAFTYDDANGDGKLTRRERTGPDAFATIGAILGLLEQPFPLGAKQIDKPLPALNCGR